jgi:demethylmenaquinone methyltransferase / 2-methoxy-6-polyprenyl-1,4-benzoquinol methylase
VGGQPSSARNATGHVGTAALGCPAKRSLAAVNLSSHSKPDVIGASPEGGTDTQAAASAVREMFTAIAPRYDLLNHLLSFNVDRLWWRGVARIFTHILVRPDARILDLCCGTGDMAFALHRRAGKTRPKILGVDFSHAMLQRASAKSKGIALRWIEADALRLPFAGAQFDLVSSAFGFRNLADYDAGLREIARVLRPGGECGILDFCEPGGFVGKLYRVYFKHVLPTVGTVISGVKGPYAYLPASVERFPQPDEMLLRMRRAGFQHVSWTPYTFGIAGLYRGRK